LERGWRRDELRDEASREFECLIHEHEGGVAARKSVQRTFNWAMEASKAK
jgi:hypothetical protein